jgi:hypothetical protein
VKELEVDWPTGIVNRYYNLKADEIFVARERIP